MIRLEQVRFGYVPGVEVLSGVSLELPPGLCLLLGPNGCGKSTLLKLAAGVERPWGGSVSVAGHDLWREEVAGRACLAYVPEHPDLTPYATVAEVLTLVADLRREPGQAVREALAWVGLEACAARTVRELSQGERRRAVIAAARIGTPPCLLLDEPLGGVDRSFRGELVRWISERRAAGGTVVVVSHELDPFAGLADRAVSLVGGRCRAIDPLPRPGPDRFAALDQLARGLATDAVVSRSR